MDNATRGRRFRELITLQLRFSGLPVEERPGRRPSFSETLAGDHTHPRSDILGVPDFAIVTRAQDTLTDVARGMSEARDAAEHDGKKRAAVIQLRRAHPARDAWVILSLDDFAGFIRDHQEAS
jgi:hypothetical protein